MDIGSSPVTGPYEESILKCIPEPQYPLSVYKGPPLTMSEEYHRYLARWRYTVPNGRPSLIWLVWPSIESIKQVVTPYIQTLFPETVDVFVEFLAKGTFNKAYTITAIGKEARQTQSYVFRIAAPTFPYYKIESEVATMELVRHSTSVPVPIVYAYSSSWYNPVGHEWILMEKVQGRRAYEVYDNFDWTTKVDLAREVALWTKELSKIKSNMIGSIFMARVDSQLKFYVGPCVAGIFFQERNLWYDTFRGPFKDLQSYYQARLFFHKSKMRELGYPAPDIGSRPTESTRQNGTQLNHESETGPNHTSLKPVLTDMERVWAEADKHDAKDHRYRAPKEHFQHILWCLETHERSVVAECQRLRPLQEQINCVLMHHDIAPRNIMVNEANECVSLLDWEYIYLIPAPCRSGFPQYLNTRFRSHRPVLESYLGYLYDDHYFERFNAAVAEYENGLLRPIFEQELEKIAPALADEFWSEKWSPWHELHRHATSANVFTGGRPAWVDDPAWLRKLPWGRGIGPKLLTVVEENSSEALFEPRGL